MSSNIALPALSLNYLFLIPFCYICKTVKEPQSSLQEPVSEEKALDSHIDEHDSSESDIQGILY